MDYMDSILAPIQRELDEFKAYYATLFSSTDAKTDTLLKFLLQRKGKSMRPILVLLVAAAVGKIDINIYRLAASVELMHQGSLIHDDVVDESSLRRGKPSVNSSFGNKLAVLLGDYIVSQSLQQITATVNQECLDEISKLIGTLSEGEIMQIEALDEEELSESSYFNIISRKTALLFSTSAKLAAKLAGASNSEIKAFNDYALNAGLCFQIMDDILDYHDSSETGKSKGNDLKEGKFTLPAIYALNKSIKDWSKEIKAIKGLNADYETIQKVTAYTLENGGIQYAIDTMNKLKYKALKSLPQNINNDIKQAFKSYLELITDRKF